MINIKLMNGQTDSDRLNTLFDPCGGSVVIMYSLDNLMRRD